MRRYLVKMLSAVLISAMIVLIALSSAYATGYTYTSLNYAGAPTYAIGINNGGTVVGYYEGTDGIHGFSYNGTTYTTLHKPGASSTLAYGINNGGTIVGRYADATGWHGFSLSGGTYTTIDYLGASRTDAYGMNGINNSGTIVGAYSDAGSNDTVPIATHGYSLSGGTYTALNYSSASVTFTSASGINDAGTIVGQYYDATGAHGFSLSGGAYTSLDCPGYLGITNVVRINNSGTIVGYTGGLAGGTGFTLSGGVYYAVSYPGTPGTIAVGINDGGTIVGYYRDPQSGTVTGFLATLDGTSLTPLLYSTLPPSAVPIPGAIFLFAPGLAGLMRLKRKYQG
jgi:hypothetical protein